MLGVAHEISYYNDIRNYEHRNKPKEVKCLINGLDHLDQIGITLDFYISKYENIILLGDFNYEESDPPWKIFFIHINSKI